MKKANDNYKIVCILSLLKEREDYLNNALKLLNNAKEPISNLKINKRNNRFVYLLYDSLGQKRYIKKEEEYIAKENAQETYNYKIKQLILTELKSITYYKSHLPNVTADSLYDKLSPGRKQLITPISESKEEFIAKWEKAEYEQKYSINVGADYITEKGERVRSKSEILIANMLYKYNIPYHYEKPLKLKNRIIYPDFTILDTFSLKEYYWEHLGMLDDPEYATKTVVKLNSYEEAGIFTGESLILSRECKDAPLSTTQIKRIIKHYFSV